ncbi:hypothetical protein LRS13_09155 [Svornostia abyssi]|uniref:Transketolase-like pyrimidine-binding domain-containing protein n=1 Tax=Svornostia abyssi TaxID=2898438 RepID=A0ABY5PLW3_9ACTN|nr:hypothetical protein LRS13_09155 [Parviterribacteraceae bacterium J379]
MAATAYVPAEEVARIRSLADPIARTQLLADVCRLNTLYMIKRAGSGHVGTSFSAMELLVWLHAEVLTDADRVFSSKGHDAPGTYAVMAATGSLDPERIHGLRRLGGLPGHPDVASMPEMVTSTGSLGMGISKARGFVLADRLLGRTGRVFVLTGDGELQEGQFWESLQPTANRGLHEICVIVDHNKLQSDTWVSEVSDLGDLEAKLRAFGWAVGRCDGHDVAAFSEALETLWRTAAGRPQILIADTVKGGGVSFMEPHDLPVTGDALYAFHSGAPSDDEYARAFEEITARIDAALGAAGVSPLRVADAPPAPPAPAAPVSPQRLVAAYGDALADAAARRRDLVALDGDLALDTGLVRFRAEHPERFIECGIAEQDMVSSAGTMALSGVLPAVHSFACFLTPRANEQIFNNATEGTKVLYAGSLAGIVPGGPGHSHQAVRDIGVMANVPGMTLVEPYCEAEARQLVDWAVDDADGPVYVRLVSVPWDLGFDPPEPSTLRRGCGTVLREGGDVLLVATGPVLVSQAWAAARALEADGLHVGVVALPWLRDVDPGWLSAVAADAPIVTLDNHVLPGGRARRSSPRSPRPAAVCACTASGCTACPRAGRTPKCSPPMGSMPTRSPVPCAASRQRGWPDDRRDRCPAVPRGRGRDGRRRLRSDPRRACSLLRGRRRPRRPGPVQRLRRRVGGAQACATAPPRSARRGHRRLSRHHLHPSLVDRDGRGARAVAPARLCEGQRLARASARRAGGAVRPGGDRDRVRRHGDELFDGAAGRVPRPRGGAQMSLRGAFDAVVTHHRATYASGVARFNEILAERLGIAFLALDDPALAAVHRPLLSFKASELQPADRARVQALLLRDDLVPDAYLHNWTGSELEHDLIARCERVWCGNLEVRAGVAPLHGDCRDAFTPGLILDQREFAPCEVTVFSFGMAHKLQTEQFLRLRGLLEASGRSYAVHVSSATHATANLRDDEAVFEEMRDLFPSRLFFLGHLSDVAIFNAVRDATFFASFFPGGVRANNTSVAAAMEQGAVVITNLDHHSPPEYVHGVNLLDITRLDTLPTDRTTLRRIGVAAAETAEQRSWDTLVASMTRPPVRDRLRGG